MVLPLYKDCPLKRLLLTTSKQMQYERAAHEPRSIERLAFLFGHNRHKQSKGA